MSAERLPETKQAPGRLPEAKQAAGCPFCSSKMQIRYDGEWFSHPYNGCIIAGMWFNPEKWAEANTATAKAREELEQLRIGYARLLAEKIVHQQPNDEALINEVLDANKQPTAPTIYDCGGLSENKEAEPILSKLASAPTADVPPQGRDTADVEDGE